MNAWRHMVVVFGGVRKREYLADVALLDTHNLCWLHAEPTAAEPTFGAVKNSPSARAYHSATLVHNRLYVFGGEDSTGLLPPDVHALDLLTLSWVRHKCSGHVPVAVRDHVAIAAGSRMLVVGGSTAAGYVDGSKLAVLETETMVWAQVRCSGQVPSARAGHAVAMTPSMSEGGWDLCIFGGGDGLRGFSDLFRLDLTSSEWSKVNSEDDATNGLTPREGASGTCFYSYC
ncbi:hypothetical protein T492DRAFT_403997 [Pavlovales sp. CCMP2436]|nr:hypothetical protein T492DRAFT_403997 [Pavlovales sp. CCMP2436]